MNFVNKSSVKKFVHEQGKHIGARELLALNEVVKSVLMRAVNISKHFKRIKPEDIYLSGVKQQKL